MTEILQGLSMLQPLNVKSKAHLRGLKGMCNMRPAITTATTAASTSTAPKAYTLKALKPESWILTYTPKTVPKFGQP